jgi:hypothetical protein
MGSWSDYVGVRVHGCLNILITHYAWDLSFHNRSFPVMRYEHGESMKLDHHRVEVRSKRR